MEEVPDLSLALQLLDGRARPYGGDGSLRMTRRNIGNSRFRGLFGPGLQTNRRFPVLGLPGLPTRKESLHRQTEVEGWSGIREGVQVEVLSSCL